MKSQEEKQAARLARQELRRQAKETARIDSEKNQKPVKELTITIEWRKSRMWGSNPHASVQVIHHDGTYDRKDGYTCSGCGYDKESTVIAMAFNDFLKYKLWNMTRDQIKGGHGSLDNGPAPYGISSYSEESRGYAGGIGTSCYYGIAKFIGGKFDHVAGGKAFDVFKYTDNE